MRPRELEKKRKEKKFKTWQWLTLVYDCRFFFRLYRVHLYYCLYDTSDEREGRGERAHRQPGERAGQTPRCAAALGEGGTRRGGAAGLGGCGAAAPAGGGEPPCGGSLVGAHAGRGAAVRARARRGAWGAALGGRQSGGRTARSSWGSGGAPSHARARPPPARARRLRCRALRAAPPASRARCSGGAAGRRCPEQQAGVAPCAPPRGAPSSPRRLCVAWGPSRPASLLPLDI